TAAVVGGGNLYVFVRSGASWSLQQEIAGTGCSSIAVADSGILLCGQPDKTVGANAKQGSATIFARVSNTWTAQQTLTASDGTANSSFGARAAISGTTVAVAAPFGSFAAYVYVKSGASWVLQQEISVGVANGVALDGNTLAVAGAYDSYIFTRTG